MKLVRGASRAAATGALLLGLAALAATRAPDEPAHGLTEVQVRRALALSPLGPPPPDPTNRVADDPRAAALGQFLFFDAALSADGERSCASCHDPALGLSDGKPLAEGLAPLERRSPSLWNVAYQRWLFWDGRADSLWAQAVQPLESDLEMGGDRVALALRVFRHSELQTAYEALFGPLPPLDDAVRFPAHGKPEGAPEVVAAWEAMAPEDRDAITLVLVNLMKSVAAYERRLVSRGAPFDRFVEGLRENDAGKLAALDASARRGLALFVGRGRCRVCHAGPNLSDGEFHALPLPTADGRAPTDPGRYEGLERLRADPFNAAGRWSDDREGERAQELARLAGGPEAWGEFRTPSLRQLSGRGPFTHAGVFADLGEVLHFYSTLEGRPLLHAHAEQVLLPLELDEGELADLTAFLASLDGAPLPPELLRPPASPLPDGADGAR